MLPKLLFQNQDKKQLIIAIIGAFLGITFLVTSIHYLIRVNEFGRGAEILGPNTIIVQKKVNNSAVLGLAKTDFTEREIEKMKQGHVKANVHCSNTWIILYSGIKICQLFHFLHNTLYDSWLLISFSISSYR